MKRRCKNRERRTKREKRHGRSSTNLPSHPSHHWVRAAAPAIFPAANCAPLTFSRHLFFSRASLVEELGRLGEGFPLQRVLQRVLAAVGSGAPAFSEEEEQQLAGLVAGGAAPAGGAGAPSAAHAVRVLLEGCAYLFETAAFHNLKTAAFGQALLQAGLGEAQAVVFGGVWTAGSAAVVNRLKARPLGAPRVLQATSYRVALSLGSTAATDLRETTAVVDFELADSLAEGAAAAREVVSVEMGREGMVDLLAKLDAIQSQIDSLTS